MKSKAFQVILIVLIIVGLYAVVRVIADPTWYFGKSLVGEGVAMDDFWAVLLEGRK